MKMIIKKSVFLANTMRVLGFRNLFILAFMLPGSRVYAQCEVDLFTAIDPSPWALFGDSVATTFDGQYIIAGAHQDDENGASAGAAYIYSLDQGSWSFQTKLLASDGEAGDHFGFTVVLTADGNYAVIDSSRSNFEAGAVYVFQRRGSTWIQLDKLVAEDPAVNAFMGVALAVSSDASTITASASNDDKDIGENVGALYIFVRQGDKWIQQVKLTASDAEAQDRFGNDVALSADGNLALIGAHMDSDGALNAGSVYVFERSGETWTEIIKLHASVPDQSANFGAAISLSDDGNTALIGARNEGATNAGAAYIFVRQDQTWIEQAHLLPPPGLGGFFGADVSISADGNTAMVAASEEFARGSAYIFTRDGDQWNQAMRVTSCHTVTDDTFAGSVALSGDGVIAVAGARWEDGQFENQGWVHVFDLTMEPCFVGDFDCNGVVETFDLLVLLLDWGPCKNCLLHCKDLTGDCVVGTADLLILLSNWG